MKKILVAEDDRFLARALKDKLTRSGFETINVYNGNEAIDQMLALKPDLVLLDLMMPLTNGFEVLEEIKLSENLAGIPVIVLSNLGQESDVEKAKELGAVDFFVKADIPIKEVVEKVKFHLAKS